MKISWALIRDKDAHSGNDSTKYNFCLDNQILIELSISKI